MKYITASILIVLFIACKKPHPQYNEITKIELARSGAWSDFGSAISIDSALNYKYYDGNSKKNYTGKITTKFWDSVNNRFNKLNLKSLQSRIIKIYPMRIILNL